MDQLKFPLTGEMVDAFIEAFRNGPVGHAIASPLLRSEAVAIMQAAIDQIRPSLAAQFAEARGAQGDDMTDTFVRAYLNALPAEWDRTETSTNVMIAMATAAGVAAVAPRAEPVRHVHYHVPEGSILSVVGDDATVEPIMTSGTATSEGSGGAGGDDTRYREGQAVLGMLLLSGELGGKREIERERDYLRRLLDFVTRREDVEGLLKEGALTLQEAAEEWRRLHPNGPDLLGGLVDYAPRPDRTASALKIAQIMRGHVGTNPETFWAGLSGSTKTIAFAIYDFMVEKWPPVGPSTQRDGATEN